MRLFLKGICSFGFLAQAVPLFCRCTNRRAATERLERAGGNYGFRRFGELRMIRITSFLSGRPLGYLTTRLSPTSIKEMEYIRPNLGYLN